MIVRPLIDEIEQSIEHAIASILTDYPQATVGISVRDDSQDVACDLNADMVLHAASTMKLPVMIEVFRRVNEETLSFDDSLPLENAFRSIVDGSRYAIEDDSNDPIKPRLGERLSVRELVFQMITLSSNIATNILIEHLTPNSVQNTVQALGIRTMRVLRGVEDLQAFRMGLNNTTTSRDLATLLRRLASGTAVSKEMDLQMIKILEAQQHNEMIPAGIPAGVAVAHKTGQILGIHHDAAIVDPDNQPYVLVILTRGLSDEKQSAALGARVATAVHAALRGVSNES